MLGSVSDEIEVKVAASQAWKVYGTLQLANLARQHLSHIIHKIDVLEGDGAAGTVLKLTFASPNDNIPPGDAAPYHKEKFTVVDDEKRVKVAEVIEGGHLEQGFSMYRVCFQVMENGENSCITKVTIEYELKEEGEANANASSLVTTQPFVLLMRAVADYLTNN